MEDPTPRRPLRLGLIPFLNLLPISAHLHLRGLAVEIVEGVPRRMNQALRSGMLDVAPASSIEYLRNPELYHILRDMSISSRGAVRSVAVFSQFPIDQWEGRLIACATESETSVALLEVLLRRLWKVNAVLVDENKARDPIAFLRIGDRALRELWSGTWKYVWDLGEEWYKWTNLPFVFAIWLVRTEVAIARRHLVEKVHMALIQARQRGLRKLESCVSEGGKRLRGSPIQLREYFKGLDYTLGQDHLLGLERFARELYEIGRIQSVPTLSLWP